MVNRNYRIGYNFERRVIKFYKKEYPDAEIVRQGKSKFPDIWVILPNKSFPCECKVGKYLDGTEKMLAKALVSKGFSFRVAYRNGKKLDFWDGGIKEKSEDI